MRVGYARISTSEQSLDLQVDALRAAGCEAIYQDVLSGAARDRPGLDDALSSLSPGDTLVVWRLDRLARSMRDLTETVSTLNSQDIGFQSIREHIDISSAYGEFVLHILSAVAHFERSLIVERTRAGMAAAKARGAQFGRQPVLSQAQLLEADRLVRGGQSVSSVARDLDVGRSTLYRNLSLLHSE